MKFGETTPSIGGPSFPWEAPNVYQHLMELRARGELREEDLDDLPDARFIEKYGADEYWQRTRAAREDGAVGYAGHAPNEAGVGGIAAAAERASTPRGDAPGPNPAPPPADDWSNPQLPTLAEIRQAGYERRHAKDSPDLRGGMRRLCDEEELHPENLRAARGMATEPWRRTPESAMNVNATRMLSRVDAKPDFV